MSNSTLAVRILPETERSLAFGGISGAYAPVGTPLGHAAVNIVFQNLTAGIVNFSWDGINPWMTFAAGASFVLDIQSNKGRSDALLGAAGTQFYVRQTTAPVSGAVYISVLYGANFDNL